MNIYNQVRRAVTNQINLSICDTTGSTGHQCTYVDTD